MNQITIPEALQAQADEISTVALRFALEPDAAFVECLKQMHRGMLETYLGEDNDTIAAADAWAKEFLQAAAVQRHAMQFDVGLNASRSLH